MAARNGVVAHVLKKMVVSGGNPAMSIKRPRN
jgi:hypothetical protein